MNFFNRAIKNTTRRLSKTILLVLTFFLIGNLVIIGLGIAKASENAKILTRKKMRAVVTMSLDYDAIWKYVETLSEEEAEDFYKNYPSITYEEIKELIKDERVKTANVITMNELYKTDTFDYVHLNNRVETEGIGGGQSCYYNELTGQEECVEYQNPSFYIKANFLPNMIEFSDGEFTLTNGRFYSQEEIDTGANVVVISEALAAQNGLKVGDSFEVYTSSPSELGTSYAAGLTLSDITLRLQIIGLFTHTHPITPDQNNFDYTYPYENPDNLMFMPSSTVFSATLVAQQKRFDNLAQMYPDDEYYQDPANRPTLESIDKMQVSEATLLLNDPLEVDAFVEEYSAQLSDFKKLDANNDEFKRLAKPLDTLNLYASFIVWLVVINAIVIITLVTALTLKNREYEIGVLLAIGATKLKVIMQFFVELAIVAILGFTLAIGSGSLIANKVGSIVLDYQLASSEVEDGNDYDYRDDNYNIWDSNYQTEISMDDMISEYNVNISPVIIAEIYILGLGIVLISIVIPSMMIMRYNPKRILMSQG